ncbi:MAG: hypothetical protein M1826_006998 [Phylliscum demangeonii]|nr:MAG: hypothetical protein M1826_006998 [Phylliscum demangeonii]
MAAMARVPSLPRSLDGTRLSPTSAVVEVWSVVADPVTGLDRGRRPRSWCRVRAEARAEVRAEARGAVAVEGGQTMRSYDERASRSGMLPPPRDAVRPFPAVTVNVTVNGNGNGNGNAVHAVRPEPPYRHRHLWIVTGPAGCGKTTIGRYMAEKVNVPYIEGDEFHPAVNVRKMADGIPLTDEDRWDWLVLLRQTAVERLMATAGPGVVLTCSALKHKYRDVIRIAAYNDHHVIVHFIFLRADEQILTARVRARPDHFMKASMVHSQFASLEEPEDDEPDCVGIDVSGSLGQVQRQALRLVQETLADDSS